MLLTFRFQHCAFDSDAEHNALKNMYGKGAAKLTPATLPRDAASSTSASQEKPVQPLRRPHDRPFVCGAQVLRLINLGLPLKGPFYGRGEQGLLGSARQTRSHMVPAPRSASAPPWIFRGTEEAASASRGAPQSASEASAFGTAADAAAEPISTGNGSSERPAPQVPQRRDHRLLGSMDCTRCASSGLVRGRERKQLLDCPHCNGRGIVPVYLV